MRRYALLELPSQPGYQLSQQKEQALVVDIANNALAHVQVLTAAKDEFKRCYVIWTF